LPAAVDELTREPHLQVLVLAGKPTRDAFEVRGAAKHPQRHLVGRVELKEMPTQTLLRASALIDEIVAVTDQQLDLPVDALVRTRSREARLADRGPGDRQGVDRVRLAAGAA